MGTDTRGRREREPRRQLEGGRCEPSPEASASVTPAVLVANQKLIGHERGRVQVPKGGKLSRALGETRDGSGEGKRQTTERLGVRLTQWVSPHEKWRNQACGRGPGQASTPCWGASPPSPDTCRAHLASPAPAPRAWRR